MPFRWCPNCLLERVSPIFARVSGLELALEDLNREFAGRYEFRRYIERGATGAVYHAFDLATSKDVAIKVLVEEITATKAVRARFEAEAAVMKRLSHGNIVRILDSGVTPIGLPYLVMDLVDGCDLRSLYAERTMQPSEALDLFSQICDAVTHAHSLGVLHLDLKPQNILVDGKDCVRVTDFGIARIVLPPTYPGATQGTLGAGDGWTFGYSAPEQIAGKRVDERADIYSLGAVLYEMLTGKLPVGAWKRPSECLQVDSRLDATLEKSLQPDPLDRHGSVAEFSSELLSLNTPLRIDSGISKPKGNGPNAAVSMGSSGNHPAAEAIQEKAHVRQGSPPQPSYKKRYSLAIMSALVGASLAAWLGNSGWRNPSGGNADRMTVDDLATAELPEPRYHTLISADFDDSTPFGVTKNSKSETALNNGFYTMRRTDYGSFGFSASASEAGDSTLIRTRTRISNSGIYAAESISAFWGVGFRSSGNGTYRVEIRGDGNWRFYCTRGGDYEAISPWSFSTTVRPAGDFNDLAIEAKGNRFEITINGTKLGSFEHQGPKSGCQQLHFGSHGNALLECDSFELLEQIN